MVVALLHTLFVVAVMLFELICFFLEFSASIVLRCSPLFWDVMW
jgi:hypothetical protein